MDRSRGADITKQSFKRNEERGFATCNELRGEERRKKQEPKNERESTKR